MRRDAYILGGGVTGLAAGMASGLTVLESEPVPGGICRSYYMRPGGGRVLLSAGREPAYRFEVGGGHWMFGGNEIVLRLIESLVPVSMYERRAAVFFPDTRLRVPYPLQAHVDRLDRRTRAAAKAEMGHAAPRMGATMAEWLQAVFGPTLNRLFFAPFHELYTAGLYREIAPQDAYKSPSAGKVPPGRLGYNAGFVYPRTGLDVLTWKMAARCRMEFGRRVVAIDPDRRLLTFADGTQRAYLVLLSTLPLNRTLALAGLRADQAEDPYTSVLVLNLGARRGPGCPTDHWVYLPQSSSGFHRVGFYSNVDPAFAPAPDRVGIYVERSFRGGERPSPDEVDGYASRVVRELQGWGYIGEVEALNADWVEVAYTWTRPRSTWRSEALARLESRGIYPIGRYGRWTFQGMAASIREGLAAGTDLRALSEPGAFRRPRGEIPAEAVVTA